MTRICSKPSQVLVFNSVKRLIAIYASITSAAKSFGVRTQSVYYACTGKTISCSKMYFRALDDNIEVTLEDLGVLTLTEYDKLCGVERKVYRTKDMSRVGMRYAKKNNITSKRLKNETERNHSKSNV